MQLKSLSGVLNHCGKTKTTWKILNLWGLSLYALQTSENTNLIGADEFKFNYIKDQRLRNVGTLISNLYHKSQVAFKIVCVQVNKKYRKKLKKRYLFQLTYVPVRLRQRFFYKLLSKIMQQSDKRGFQNKYIHTMGGCLLNFQTSPLFSFKKAILSKLAKTTK